VDDAALRRYLQVKAESAGGVTAFADMAGVSRQTMSEMIAGRMKPSPAVLVYLGT
jgi:DNA-binding XRE family transcriptional regulator